MGKMTYAEQLRHPLWQRKRLETMESSDFACESCGDKSTTLHVHRKRYVKGRMAWEYEEHELQTLCEPCHAQQHEKRDLLDRLLVSSGDATYGLAIGLLAGYLEVNLSLHEDLQEDCRALGREFVYGQMAGLFGNMRWREVGALAASIDRSLLNPAERIFVQFLIDHGDC